MTLNGNVTSRIFEIYRIKIRAQASTFFSLRIFLFFYIDIHIVHEKEKMYSLALIYSKGCKSTGGVKWECDLMRGPQP